MSDDPKKRNATAAHSAQVAGRQREKAATDNEIGDLPPVKDPARREACRSDLERFLVAYFPNSTGLSPFSADHKRVIARAQQCLVEGGRFANACYRGWAKTSILEGTCIWGAIYGHRRFIPLFGADNNMAQVSLESIKTELVENELLAEDFPEICIPLQRLGGKPQKCASQTYRFEPTHCEWSKSRIRFPAIPGAAGAERVIVTRGILSGFRGLKVKLTDGTQQRPDGVLLDDVQTDETARTPLQVAKTLRILRKAIGRLGGHRSGMAMILCGTVIEHGDAVDSLLSDPAWQAERIPMVRRWPDAQQTLWLETYAGLRRNFDRASVEDQARAHREATEFYLANRDSMDAGAEVSWESCYDAEKEISALQHAENILIDDGAEAFASECQNDPLRAEDERPVLTPAEVCAKVGPIARGVVPAAAAYLTAFVDVQNKLLPWALCAFGDDFTGQVVAYGTYPKQQRRDWTADNASPTLLDVAPRGSSEEGAIRAGLEALTQELCGREWPGEIGGVTRVTRALIDSGYKADVVHEFCRQSLHAAIVMPSKGRGIGAKGRPMEMWTVRPGDKAGLNWHITRLPTRAIRLVHYDTNFWKSFLFSRLALALGDRGALTLHKAAAADHRLFAEHVTSERPTRLRNQDTGRTVDEWTLLPGAGENHWLDCAVGCCVAASMLGAGLDGPRKPRPKPKTMQEMRDEAARRRVLQ
jgi:hypothetical protein